ncbi:hypothetical protein AB0I22_28800 [Streptomyces sp. NPDC050610]|uniref:hypothetical protein n=1 Tax=Streptomyces sp. NPDC050610 TaxID=3157097 RepID=UPI00344840E1
MAAGGWTYAALAQQVEVDPKSVERWVDLGRIPRRATALQAAKALGEDVHALWPALRQARPARAISPELVALYESRCRLALMHYKPLADTPGIEVRTHGTTLYNSLYRADDQQLVNAHIWGVNAYAAPVWHLRRHQESGMFDTYADSFDAVWATATPVREED